MNSMKWTTLALLLSAGCATAAASPDPSTPIPDEVAAADQTCVHGQVCEEGYICTLGEREAQQGTCEKILADEGEVCGTIAGTQCEPELFCDIEDPSMGNDQRGSCTLRPQSCPDIALEGGVCGRDGEKYPTECHANMAGVDIVTVGAETVCG